MDALASAEAERVVDKFVASFNEMLPAEVGTNPLPATMKRHILEFALQPNFVSMNNYVRFHVILNKLTECYATISGNTQLTNLVEKLLEELTATKRKDSRMVAIDYHIAGAPLHHRYDLDLFVEKIVHVAHEWKTKKDDKVYVAPYFCFIQSSGMGKTKIMYEFQKSVKDGAISVYQGAISCDLVVSAPQSLVDSGSGQTVFARQMNFDWKVKNQLDAAAASSCVYTYLDETFLSDASELRQNHPRQEHIHVIMFDEAQFLLDTKFEEEAFFFRCIRVWLRKKRMNATIVAVFASTSSAFENNNIKSDEDLELKASSRQRLKEFYYAKGTKTFAPFMSTTTMGVIPLDGADRSSQSEYEQSIEYGRPLFATMHANCDLAPMIPTILHRILLTDGYNITSWRSSEASWLSVLATRVQMGSTSVKLTSKLVARSYANLVAVFGRDNASFCYIPDPVCARLAMCMMDEGWYLFDKSINATFKGQSKEWWTGKLNILYSGLCRPDKEDIGEVMVALYMMFCGDECRRRVDQTYMSFSILLSDWIDSLLTPEQSEDNDDQMSAPTSCTSKLDQKDDVQHHPTSRRGKVEVSFIQVCRNSLRHYDYTWEDFSDQLFLKHLYEAGTAFYTFPRCQMIDLAAPMRLSIGDKSWFGALLVSIKSQKYFAPGPAAKLCSAMKERAVRDKLNSTLCLLVIFGQKATSKDQKDCIWNETMLDDLIDGKNASAVVRLPLNDRFKLSDTLCALTNSYAESDLLTSHSFIRALAKDSRTHVEGTDAISNFVTALDGGERNPSKRGRTL